MFQQRRLIACLTALSFLLGSGPGLAGHVRDSVLGYACPACEHGTHTSRHDEDDEQAPCETDGHHPDGADRSCPCRDHDAPCPSCPCPGGCAYCSVAKVPCCGPAVLPVLEFEYVGHTAVDGPVSHLPPFSDGMIRPPRA